MSGPAHSLGLSSFKALITSVVVKGVKLKASVLPVARSVIGDTAIELSDLHKKSEEIKSLLK